MNRFVSYRWIMRSIALLLLTAVVGTAAQIPTLSIGASAPPFELPGVDGKTYRLQDFDASPVLVVIFTCNHCPTAQFYEERIKQLVSDYQDRGVAFVAISANDETALRLNELGYTDLSDSLEEMKIRAQDREFNFPYLYAGDRPDISMQYGPTVTPHTFVFDSERKLRYVGRIDNNERVEYATVHNLRDALDAVLAGREVAVPTTRAFGCSTKWPTKRFEVDAYLKEMAALPVSVELVDADGLRALRANQTAENKIRLVNFWATWCGPCIVEFPQLVDTDRRYRHRRFEFVSVAANFPDEKDEVLHFLKQRQASNRNLLFGSTDKYALMEAFDPEWSGTLPYTVLIDDDGTILYRKEGQIDPLELRREIIKAVPFERRPTRVD